MDAAPAWLAWFYCLHPGALYDFHFADYIILKTQIKVRHGTGHEDQAV